MLRSIINIVTTHRLHRLPETSLRDRGLNVFLNFPFAKPEHECHTANVY
jgi:hypothetical protein